MKTKNIFILILLLCVAAGLAAISYYGVSAKNYGGVKNINQGLDLAGGVYIIYEAEGDINPTDNEMSAAVSMIRTRLDAKNWTEAEVAQEGANRVRVEIPGVEDAQTAVAEIGETAHLTFRDEEGNILVDGVNISNAQKQMQNSQYVVAIEFDSIGREAFAAATSSNLGKQIGIYMDETLISAPTVQSAITDGKAVITGDFQLEDADALASKIRSGSLPFKLNIIDYNSVGATLGADSLRSSIFAGIIGIFLVLLFMLIVYRMAGAAADLALVIYTGIVLVFMSLTGVTLTLPGVAGIVLSIGMAVDANVIIFERIKEEVRTGKTVKTSIKNGFSRAFPAILDSNVTTLIACVVLLWLGTGPVKGFAQTLMLGIIVSMFTALTVTRLILNSLVEAGVKNPKLYGGR